MFLVIVPDRTVVSSMVFEASSKERLSITATKAFSHPGYGFVFLQNHFFNVICLFSSIVYHFEFDFRVVLFK